MQSGRLVGFKHPMKCRQAYYRRLREKIDTDIFKVVDTIEEDGLYIGKRAIRGAQGQGDLLNQAGTVFYHTVVYIRSKSKVRASDSSQQPKQLESLIRIALAI